VAKGGISGGEHRPISQLYAGDQTAQDTMDKEITLILKDIASDPMI